MGQAIIHYSNDSASVSFVLNKFFRLIIKDRNQANRSSKCNAVIQGEIRKVWFGLAYQALKIDTYMLTVNVVVNRSDCNVILNPEFIAVLFSASMPC